MKEELAKPGVTVSTQAETVTSLGNEFRALFDSTTPEERDSVATQKVLRDFQSVLQKAEALLNERRLSGAVGREGRGGSWQVGEASTADGETGDRRHGDEMQLQQFDRKHPLNEEMAKVVAEDAIKTNEVIIRDREVAMTGISEQIGDVHQIFQDLAVMVNDQGTQIDDIESNVARASQKTLEGAVQVRRAEQRQAARDRNWCFMTILCSAAIGVLVLVLIA
jgi:syntaxin 7